MDAKALSEVMGGALSLEAYERLLPGYVNAAKAAGITTVERAAMWAAQLGHESVGLKYMEEIASGSAYNGRADLGNVHPGDGPRFRGRGPIQLTGRNNYRAFTKWARANGHSDIDFEAEPHRLSEPHWGFLAATYYWAAARPQINALSDVRNLEAVTRAINGGLNGIADRRARYQRALAMGGRILPGEIKVIEKVLDYPRDQVAQDTYYNCGPASTQTVIRAATGNLIHEVDLGRELRTHTGGTDWIGQFPSVLNRHLPGADYRSTEMPNDPPTGPQKGRLWRDIVASIDAGFGVVANIVAPPSNYPRAVHPSTIHPAYSGGTVYHYIALMGYRDDGQKKVWVADSGFRPFGYWISFDQLATLIPPKGYAYSTAQPVIENKEIEGGTFMALNDDEQRELLDHMRYVRGQLGPWPQLGKNADGQDLTLVDAISAVRYALVEVADRINAVINLFRGKK